MSIHQKQALPSFTLVLRTASPTSAIIPRQVWDGNGEHAEIKRVQYKWNGRKHRGEDMEAKTLIKVTIKITEHKLAAGVRDWARARWALEENDVDLLQWSFGRLGDGARRLVKREEQAHAPPWCRPKVWKKLDCAGDGSLLRSVWFNIRIRAGSPVFTDCAGFVSW